MQSPPTFSVIIPTCGRPGFLRVALRSLTWQTLKDFEVIVVNDGEEDVSAVVQEFCDSMPLSLLRTPRPRSGPSCARNTGIRAARGAYLCYLDDDDFYYEEHLELHLEAAQSFGRKVNYSDGIRARQKLRDGEYVTVSRDIRLSFDFDLALLAGRNITPTLTVAHRADCLKRSGLFAPYLRGHEDWDLWQRLARHYPFLHINAPTAEYLIRESSGSLSYQVADMAASWLFVRRQGMIFHTIPPVYELEQRAARARHLGAAASPAPVPVRIILCAGDAGAFLENTAALQSLEALREEELSGRAHLLVAGWGEAMPLLYQHVARQLPHVSSCLWFPEDPGRLFAANKAAEDCNAEWLLFLEPFVEPAAPGWLDALLAAADAGPDIGAVSGVLTVRGRPALSGGALSGRNDLIFNRSVPDPGGATAPEAYCLSGLCLMVRREAFLAVNGFDPAFAPWHYADADLCLRLRERGLGSVIAPGALFAWNRQNSRLVQTSSGLAGRRTFWDRWVDGDFPFERYTMIRTDWSMRPEDGLSLWPSDGVPPRSFDVPLPSHYQQVLKPNGNKQ